ncbi:putative organic solute transporter subunit alpha/Transmembrane protein [Helianthus annuus]|nr:putative organic solute transporter subunit alpha/Transmembrane protein [Helianthus annuus]
MLNDFYHDTCSPVYDYKNLLFMQFAPAYHDYVLYNHSNDTGDEGARKYRTKNLVPIGSEMENARKNKNAFASNKVDDHTITHSPKPPTLSNKRQSLRQ